MELISNAKNIDLKHYKDVFNVLDSYVLAYKLADYPVEYYIIKSKNPILADDIYILLILQCTLITVEMEE